MYTSIVRIFLISWPILNCYPGHASGSTMDDERAREVRLSSLTPPADGERKQRKL